MTLFALYVALVVGVVCYVVRRNRQQQGPITRKDCHAFDDQISRCDDVVAAAKERR